MEAVLQNFQLIYDVYWTCIKFNKRYQKFKEVRDSETWEVLTWLILTTNLCTTCDVITLSRGSLGRLWCTLYCISLWGKRRHISQNSPQRVKCRPTTILQSLVSWLNSFRFFTTFFLGSGVNAEYPATLTTWLKNSGYAVCGINSSVAPLFSFSSKNEEINFWHYIYLLLRTPQGEGT